MQSEILGLVTPQERERLRRDWVEVYKKDIPELASTDPENFREILSSVKQEDMASYLAALSPEQYQALLKLASQKRQSKDG